uniref:Uncharacterized protein n=1 Tax=Plectus sambesii TaxID=2011161 RepID=A0A914VRN1_9BILA
MMSPVPRDPEKIMDFWYSSDKWKDVLGAVEAETICVPPCLDVLKSWKRNDLNEASHLAPNISGQKGEAAFMLKFQELKMGGILVSGLESYELVASKAVPKEIIQKGEWDAIFFHQNRGIFVIEVKATEPSVTKKEVLPIAASRCIASLTILTYKNDLSPLGVFIANPSSIKADELQPTKGEVFRVSKLAPLASSYSTSQSDTEDWQQQLEK